ncbi:MAG: hypothetical protein Q9166_000392 [cf. Caloplaca sp. 2 TL-2023]
MKDLYTFDATPQEASNTYTKARKAYMNFFDELRIPYLVARAGSGAIGGHLSHEYHFRSANGEDTIVSCESCSYATNEELARRKSGLEHMNRSTNDWTPYKSWFGITKDRCRLVEAVLPQDIGARKPPLPQSKEPEINPYLIRDLFPDLDLIIEDSLSTFVEYWTERQPNSTSQTTETSTPHLTRIFDYRVSQPFIDTRSHDDLASTLMQRLSELVAKNTSISQTSLDLARFKDGDECPECGENSIKLQQAVELGHTFYLGDRYSKPMNATFTSPQYQRASVDAVGQQNLAQPSPVKADKIWFQMGCHGIGISRMIAAVADSLANEKGLVWPRVMAPFEAAILATEENKGTAEEMWDLLTRPEQGWDPLDAVLDDRDGKGLGWKMKDAELIGFPIVIILGSHFSKQGLCEVVIPRLGTQEKLSIKNLKRYLAARLDKL